MLNNTKNQQVKKKSRKQASRKLKPAPKELEEIIRLVNLISPDVELKDYFQLWEVKSKNARKEYAEWVKTSQHEIAILDKELESKRDSLSELERLDENIQRAQRYIDFSDGNINRGEALTKTDFGFLAFQECLSELPKPFDKYVKEAGEFHAYGEDNYFEALYRYTFVRDSRDKLRAIILHSKLRAEPWENRPGLPEIKTHAYIKVEEDGTITVGKDKFASAIEGVDATRIKECQICQQIFWAGRITQQGCSTACAHALRNRNYRARYKDYLINSVTKAKAQTPRNKKTK